MLAVALMHVIAASPAEAAAGQARHAQPVEAKAARPAADPIMAVVSIKSQQVTFYDADGWILRAPVSTGTTGRETPAGVFAVLEKDKDHHSSLYDDAWMPNMLRITWNGIALHGGPLPGYAASHGCVRMPFGFAEKVFDKAPMGMRVIIAPGDAEPVAFSHPSLFVPKQDAIDAMPARAQALGREADEAGKAAAAAKPAGGGGKARGCRSRGGGAQSQISQETRRCRAAYADNVLATAKSDRRQSHGRGLSSRRTPPKSRTMPAQLDAAKADAKAKQDSRRGRGSNRQDGRGQADRGRPGRDGREARRRAGLDLHQPRDAEALRAARHAQALAGRRRAVRFQPGIPGHDQGSRQAARHPHLHGGRARRTAACAGPKSAIDNGDNAKDALDRITFPQEVLDRIAPTALPLSSITISDEPLSSETNYRTEFVVVLNNQPQGGFANRTRSPDMNIARDGDDSGYGFGRQRDWAPSYGYRQPPRSYYRPQGWWN